MDRSKKKTNGKSRTSKGEKNAARTSSLPSTSSDRDTRSSAGRPASSHVCTLIVAIVLSLSTLAGLLVAVRVDDYAEHLPYETMVVPLRELGDRVAEVFEERWAEWFEETDPYDFEKLRRTEDRYFGKLSRFATGVDLFVCDLASEKQDAAACAAHEEVLQRWFDTCVRHYGAIETGFDWCARGAREDTATRKDQSTLKGRTALTVAADNGWVEFFKSYVRIMHARGLSDDIVEHLTFIDERQYSPLFAASMSSRSQPVVEYLASLGLDVNKRAYGESPPLLAASCRGAVSVIDTLLRAGADIHLSDTSGYTPLIAASFYGHVETVERLAEEDSIADIANAETGMGMTALVIASFSYTNVTEALLKIPSINVNQPDSSSTYTPLMYAVNSGSIERVRLLLDHPDIEVDKESNDGQTALMMCGSSELEDAPKIMQMLLDAGANINHQNKEKRCALHHAAIMNNVETILVLLHNGANEMVVDEHEMNPTLAAMAFGRLEAFLVLRDSGEIDDEYLEMQAIFYKQTKDAGDIDKIIQVCRGLDADEPLTQEFTPLHKPEYKDEDIMVFNDNDEYDAWVAHQETWYDEPATREELLIRYRAFRDEMGFPLPEMRGAAHVGLPDEMQMIQVEDDDAHDFEERLDDPSMEM